MSGGHGGRTARDASPATRPADEAAEGGAGPLPPATDTVFETALAVSEQRRLLAVEAAGVADWTFDVARGLLVCSPLARAMHGVGPREPVTLALHDARIHPADLAAVRALRAAAMDPAGTGRYQAEFRFLTPDGAERWVESVGRAIFADGPEGRRATHVLGAMRDVTPQRQAQAALEQLLARERATREELATILESISDAFYAVDADSRFTYVNRRAEELWGRRREDLLGRHYWTEFPNAVGSDSYRMHQHVMASRRPAHYETVSPLTGLAISVSLYPAAAGGLSCYFRDVTTEVAARHEVERLLAESERARAEARTAQEAAETARHEADLANQAKSAFLATMSHELRTPLNAMVGYTQLLELGIAGPLTAHQREYLERLTQSSQHLLALVNDILDLSKIEAGEMQVVARDATTGAAVGAALDLMRPLASAKGVRLVDSRPDDEGVPYVGDEDRVRQIVLNLLSNAVKFTPGGGTVTVACDTVGEAPPEEAQLEGSGPWAFVRVTDTGIGIAPDEQTRIFDPFHQVENGRTRTHGGTGLGLAISRRLARLMRGDLTVDSAPGAGATFTLWLPAARRAGGVQVEVAADRTTRAERAVAALQTAGLGLIGALLRERVDDVLAAYTERVCADPAIPLARAMRRPHLEDHTASLLADLAQSLVIVDDAGPDAAALLRDGSAIHRTIADAHGARRFAQGWDEAAVRRDHQVLREEVERAVRERLAPGGAKRADDVEAAVRVLLGLISRAEAVSMRAWRRAAAAAAAAGAG